MGPMTRLCRTLVEGLRGDLMIDRISIDPLPSGRERLLTRVGVWVMIAVCFGWGWGLSTWLAIDILLGADGESIAYGSTTLGRRLQTMLVFEIGPALVAAVALVMLASGPGQVQLHPGRPSWRTTLKTVPVYCALVAGAMGASRGLAHVLGAPSLPRQQVEVDGPVAVVVRLVDTAMAGPAEELALMALVVVGLRRCGYRWWVVVLVAVVVRVPFHLYYGWGALALSLWAVGVVLLYRRTGALLGIVAAHAIWNMFGAVGTPVAHVNVVLTALGLVLVIARLLEPVTSRKPGSAQSSGAGDYLP